MCDPDAGAVDAAATDAAGACTALFNFEAPAGCSLYGATLNKSPDNPANTDGFTRLYHSDVASCGSGSMAVDVELNRTTKLGGEILIPISAAGVNYNGKTFSVSLRGSVAGGPNTKFAAFLITTTYVPVLPPTPITTTFTTVSMPLPAFDAGLETVIGISLQVHNSSVDLYTGTIYFDEIDVKTTVDGGPADGGSNDVPDAGSVDTRPGDAADGGAVDVRDAPAG